MTSVDRIQGLSGSIAFKIPCRAATTAAITLSGLQSVDGVTLVADDRVLVKNQASSVDNGIWVASTSAWSRALDCNGNNDIRNGTLVVVTSGTTNADLVWQMTGTDPILPGTSAITITALIGSGSDLGNPTVDNYVLSSTIAGARSWTSRLLPGSVNVFDFLSAAQIADVQARTALVDCATGIQAAIDALGVAGGEVLFPPGKYKITMGLVIGNGTNNDVWSTKGAIRLRGVGAAGGIGDYNPVGGAALVSFYAGPAIAVHGPLNGWGVADLFLMFSTSSGAAQGIYAVEAMGGSVHGVQITGCPGQAIKITTHGYNNSIHNRFEGLYIWMNPAHPNAIGVHLDGVGVANTAYNLFDGLFIQPGYANHIGIQLEYCDSNEFHRVLINQSNAGATAVLFDYDGAPTGFPGANIFTSLGICDNFCTQSAEPDALQLAAPNTIVAFEMGNGARIPYNVGGVSIYRIPLTRNQTFYVSQSGSDTLCSGVVAEGPWLTLQHAWDMITTYYDLHGFTATIQIADGNYTAGVVCTGTVANTSTTGGEIIFQGNVANPTNVFIHDTASNTFKVTKSARIKIQYMRVAAPTGAALYASGNSSIIVGPEVYFAGGYGGYDMSVGYNGRIAGADTYTIQAGAHYGHAITGWGGLIGFPGVTVVLTGNPTFTNYFYSCGAGGGIDRYGGTWSGSAGSGVGYLVYLNGVIDTGGNGVPSGLSAGSAITGGQYN